MANPESTRSSDKPTHATNVCIPIWIFCPVMELFFAADTKASAQSSTSVCLRVTSCGYILQVSNLTVFPKYDFSSQLSMVFLENLSPLFKLKSLFAATLWRVLTHSVKSKPGRIALTRTLGPWVEARHLTRWSPVSDASAASTTFGPQHFRPAAFVTE